MAASEYPQSLPDVERYIQMKNKAVCRFIYVFINFTRHQLGLLNTEYRFNARP
jgi:hypothetical protein